MFKRISYLLFASVFVFLSCQKSDYREVKQYTIEQFTETVSLFGSSFSHDEKTILFTNNESGIYNIYTIPIEGGEATALTNSDKESIYAISFFPKDNRILYRADRGGNEIYHIYLREKDGTARDLTPGEKARSSFYGWNYEKTGFYFGSNKRDPKFMDIYLMDIADFSSKLIFQNDGGYSLGDISNDMRFIAFSKTITNHNSDMYLYDLTSSEMKYLTPHEGDVSYSPQSFSIDSKYLFYMTDEGSEFSYLNKYEVATGKSEKVEDAPWDLWYTYFSRNEKYRVVAINNDAKTEIKIYETATNKMISLPKLPAGEITSVRISDSENLMTFYHNGSNSPNNLFIYNFENGQHKQLTNSLNPEIDGADLVEAKVIRYPSFDGLEIPSILYKPQQLKPGEKAPALVWVHGGPGGQSRTGYNFIIQYFVNHGYVVLAVNNRGSSGYGKTFFKLDDLKHGEDDLIDCVEAKKYLIETGYVDEAKIGIIGGSYGGYMVLAALAFQPEAFEVGIDIFGVSNWVRTLENIPPWWESFREALYKEMGNPETDKEYLTKISPLFHAKNIVKPLMVLQGANDPRVIKPESDEIVEAVKANDVPVEYVVFDDEGHGFRKTENKIKGYKAVLDFLDMHLKKN